MSKSLESFSLKDKVIIITGGTGNLGVDYCAGLLKAGATVISWDLNPKTEEVSNKLKERGADTNRFHNLKVDITSESEVQAAVQNCLNSFGKIDALINNAAMNPAVGIDESKKLFVPYEEYPIELWEKELKVNLTGMMICTKSVAPTMMKQKNGSIVNIASEVANIAHDHRVYNEPDKFKSVAYVTTKTGILGFTRQWAARLGSYNIRVNAFSPGGVQSPNVPKDFAERFGRMNMFGRMAQPGEYNGVIIFLCSDASSFMTGANLTVDGGKSAW
ncbi:MAG: SDR family oxidoreductase [Patescibacteria group bacterium]